MSSCNEYNCEKYHSLEQCDQKDCMRRMHTLVDRYYPRKKPCPLCDDKGREKVFEIKECKCTIKKTDMPGMVLLFPQEACPTHGKLNE